MISGHWMASVVCLHSAGSLDFSHAGRVEPPSGTYHPRRALLKEMPDVFDIYTIIFLALAVFIFLRLRSVLGQRTGRERPPYDPYAARDAVRSPATDNKVVTLPTHPAETPPRPAEVSPPSAERW